MLTEDREVPFKFSAVDDSPIHFLGMQIPVPSGLIAEGESEETVEPSSISTRASAQEGDKILLIEGLYGLDFQLDEKNLRRIGID